MSSTSSELPDDAEAVKAMIRDRDEQLRHLQREFDILRRMMFGPETDKRPLPEGASPHPLLFTFLEEAEEIAKTKAVEGTVEIAPPKAPGKKGRRPRKWPLDASTIRTTFELPEEQRVCACGGPLHEIGEDVSRELERLVMTVIHEIARKKYACRACKNGVQIAPGPDRVIDKGSSVPDF